MKISEGVEWGAHCLVVLAQAPPQGTLTGRALAEYHGVSETYLVKHLQALASAGLIESVPGPKGGYRLARTPEAITMLDVVDAIEGREPAFRCTEIRQRGPLGQPAECYRSLCSINVAMMRAERAWRAELRKQTIAAIAGEVKRKSDAQAQRANAEWITVRARGGIAQDATNAKPSM